jgi:hypothetical protein
MTNSLRLREEIEMKMEHVTNDSLKDHKIVRTCHHVQDLGIKPSKHNLPDELICSECILSFKIAMGNGKNEGKSEEQIIHEYVQDDYQIFSICLDCAGQV